MVQTNITNGNNVQVVQPGSRLYFAAETLNLHGRRRLPYLENELDGHLPCNSGSSAR